MGLLRLSLTLALLLIGSGPAEALDRTPPAPRCWLPEALAGTAKERRPVYRRAPLDIAALRKRARPTAEPVAPGLRGSIRRVALPEGKKLVALTFDLCETPVSVAGYDGRIVDYLRANGIRATFFASGKWLATHGERAQQLLADPLFEIGHHGFRHRDFRVLKGAALQDEIVLAQSALGQTRDRLAGRACLAPERASALERIPQAMTLFRFPYGTCNARALAAIAEAGLLAIQWDVVSGDPDPRRSARSIAAGILARTKPGSIIVAHANGRGWNTAHALPLFVPKLNEQGYTFVTVSELLAAGEPVIASTCYQVSPGDNRHRLLTDRAPGRAAQTPGRDPFADLPIHD